MSITKKAILIILSSFIFTESQLNASWPEIFSKNKISIILQATGIAAIIYYIVGLHREIKQLNSSALHKEIKQLGSDQFQHQLKIEALEQRMNAPSNNEKSSEPSKIQNLQSKISKLENTLNNLISNAGQQLKVKYIDEQKNLQYVLDEKVDYPLLEQLKEDWQKQIKALERQTSHLRPAIPTSNKQYPSSQLKLEEKQKK